MSEQTIPATPAIDPTRVIAAYNSMGDLQLAIYVDGVKVYSPESSDAYGALDCAQAIGIECRELEVWFDGDLPESLEFLMEADARVRRQVWDEGRGAFRDPADGSLWDEEGWQIDGDAE